MTYARREHTLGRTGNNITSTGFGTSELGSLKKFTVFIIWYV